MLNSLANYLLFIIFLITLILFTDDKTTGFFGCRTVQNTNTQAQQRKCAVNHGATVVVEG